MEAKHILGVLLGLALIVIAFQARENQRSSAEWNMRKGIERMGEAFEESTEGTAFEEMGDQVRKDLDANGKTR